MRVATWNLARHSATSHIDDQRAVLDGVHADVLVLTEVHRHYLRTYPDGVLAVSSDDSTIDDVHWVGIVATGNTVADALLSSAFSAAAWVMIEGQEVIVYGSVLPWRAAPRQIPTWALPNEDASAMFKRFLDQNVADINGLMAEFPNAQMVWAGDFNQTLSGPNHGGSDRSRVDLQVALDGLHLVAWNQHLCHAKHGMKAIDLICGSRDRPVLSTERVDPQGLSDHAGYVVAL